MPEEPQRTAGQSQEPNAEHQTQPNMLLVEFLEAQRRLQRLELLQRALLRGDHRTRPADGLAESYRAGVQDSLPVAPTVLALTGAIAQVLDGAPVGFETSVDAQRRVCATPELLHDAVAATVWWGLGRLRPAGGRLRISLPGGDVAAVFHGEHARNAGRCVEIVVEPVPAAQQTQKRKKPNDQPDQAADAWNYAKELDAASTGKALANVQTRLLPLGCRVRFTHRGAVVTLPGCRGRLRGVG